jgi:hypothetical protein
LYMFQSYPGKLNTQRGTNTPLYQELVPIKVSLYVSHTIVPTKTKEYNFSLSEI